MGDGLMPEHLADYQLWQQSELRAVAGGSYLNPVTDLVKSGRELVVPEVASSGPMNFTAAGRGDVLCH